SEIKLAFSDSPASSWSTPTTIASDAADSTFDCVMDPAGNIQLVYGEQSTHYLVTRRLTFSDGEWSVGSSVAIYNGAQCYDPSVAIELSGTLWVSWSRFSTPNRCIYVKSSTDDGATWGLGASDVGTQMSNSSMFAWSCVAIDNNSIHVIYHDQNTSLSIRSRALSGGSWSSEYNIDTGSSFDRHFDVGIGADGRVGVVFNKSQLYYREYDGNNWGAIITLDTQPAICPQLLFYRNTPVVVFQQILNGVQVVTKYTDRRTGSFSAPAVLDSRAKPYDSVLLYDASSDSYEDLTSESESYTVADIYHSDSSCLLKDSGDTAYLGMDARFRYVRLELSTPGVGGTVIYSYWDGTNWQAFTPVSGSSDLTGLSIDLLLWTDYGSVPVDWQKCAVNSQTRFWVKVEVASVYSTGPVGTQITAASKINRMIFRR
ncbi:MAG: hypothetical protein DRP45_10965, partial [Candidatus Zixiibacteriota bacterium]